jgi:hypothetical protein
MRGILVSRVCIALAAVIGPAIAAAQGSPERSPPPTADADAAAAQAEGRENCVLVPGATDFTVLDDRHVYMRTRGSNHYLLTTEQCENITSSFIRREVQLVPYGREVCSHDGSYLLYTDRGRQRTCYLERVQKVDNRAAARELAAALSPAVEFEALEGDPGRSPADDEDSEPQE